MSDFSRDNLSDFVRDVMIVARQEAHRMRHYFIGVEHLFIGLLEIKGGITTSLLADEGLLIEYVIDAIRRRTGKGSRDRIWPDLPDTPRAKIIMGIAQELAFEEGRKNIQERDLLMAILEENDNIPVRVLNALGINMPVFRENARTRQVKRSVTGTFTKIDIAATFEGDLDHDQMFILRRMFHGYSEVRIEARLTRGFSSAVVLIATPIHADQRADASVVVKIGPSDAIQEEAIRYDRYVKNTLPPLTARLEDRPIAPDNSNYAALKYTLLTDTQGQAMDLGMMLNDWTALELGKWLYDQLYRTFGDRWWKQSRKYVFEAWKEYEWLLPPALTLQYIDTPDNTPVPPGTTIIKPGKRPKLDEVEYGAIVQVANYIVQKVDPDKGTIWLALGDGMNTPRASEIEVTNIDFSQDTYFRGEAVEKIYGRVWRTRHERLLDAVRALQPDFDLKGEFISVNQHRLPNPLRSYMIMLEHPVEGMLSVIHGDLHPGNILIGPNHSALLIDFAHTRNGHTLFDWANLEVSLLAEIFTKNIRPDWSGVREVFEHIYAAYRGQTVHEGDPIEALAIQQLVGSLRRIVRECVSSPNKLTEFYIGVFFCSMRAVTWENTLSLAGRRLLFLLAALAVEQFRDEMKPDSKDKSSNATATDQTRSGEA